MLPGKPGANLQVGQLGQRRLDLPEDREAVVPSEEPMIAASARPSPRLDHLPTHEAVERLLPLGAVYLDIDKPPLGAEKQTHPSARMATENLPERGFGGSFLPPCTPDGFLPGADLRPILGGDLRP